MIRKTIIHFFRDKYAIDESIFTYINGAQEWVIGMIQTTNKIFRFYIIFERNANNIEKFIKKIYSLKQYNYHDGWS